MTLLNIAVFVLLALAYLWVVPARWRQWVLLVGSLVAIYWLQPSLPIRRLDFALPTATIIIAILGWILTKSPKPDDEDAEKVKESLFTSDDRLTLIVSAGIVLLLSATRFLEPQFRLTSRPPDPLEVGIILAVIGVIGVGLWRIRSKSLALTGGFFALVVIFIFIKTEALTILLAEFFRGQVGQDVSIAGVIDIEWLGFSYVAFRLIHTIRDRQMGRLPNLSLREYLTYIIFFPAYTAGPIDLADRFVTDYRALETHPRGDAPRTVQGLTRISVGLFKKFIIADSLALFSLSLITAEQATSTGSVWLLLYVYAFRLYFDFSGYSDIAIGIGILFGIQLPENFNRPYLKNNIATFWQSWHMTLSSWVRSYVFSPLSRALLRRKPKPPTWLIMFICHMSTMIVIGLWHGVTWAFLIWGVWHGLGLWIHKLWTDRTRKWYIGLKNKPRTKQAWTYVGIFLTFHYVVIGWVWFAITDINVAFDTFLKLFGVW